MFFKNGGNSSSKKGDSSSFKNSISLQDSFFNDICLKKLKFNPDNDFGQLRISEAKDV